MSGSAKARRTAARLAGVQVLYQLEVGEASGAQAIYDLMQMRQDEIESKLIEPDQDLLKAITLGVTERLSDIDTLVQSAIGESRSLGRTEPILRAILRAGAFELLTDGETAPGIIINDYVNVAHAFFTESEPAKVNAVLDKVSKNLAR